MTGPDPNKVYPNENIRQVVFIKNVVKRANIVVGDYTYYDDPDGAEKFEEHVTHHYDFLDDRLVIGKFCAIARGSARRRTFFGLPGTDFRPRRNTLERPSPQLNSPR